MTSTPFPATEPAGHTIQDLATVLDCTPRYALDLVRALPSEVTGLLQKGSRRAVVIPTPLYQNLIQAKALAQQFDIPFAAILKLKYGDLPELWTYLDRPLGPRPVARPAPVAALPGPGVAAQLEQIQSTLSVIVKGQEHVLRNVTQLQSTVTPPSST